MRSTRLVFTLSLTLLLVGGWAHAQETETKLPRPTGPLPQYSFDRLDVDDGLPAERVSDFIQDRRGYLWIATEGGLVRYDGQEMHTFRPVPKEGGPPLKNVWTVYEDSDGDIWAGADAGGGLARFDQATQTWRHYRHKSDDSRSPSSDWVLRIEEAAPGRMIVITAPAEEGESGYCLDVIDAESDHARRYRQKPDGSLGSEGSCFAMANPERFDLLNRDENGRMWISTIGGLLEYDAAADSLIYHRAGMLNPYGKEAARVLNDAVQGASRLASISQIGREEKREVSFRLDRAQEVLLVGLGEIRAFVGHDYGWLESAAGDTLWTMKVDHSNWAGGEIRNRLVVKKMQLAAGNYRLRFISDMGHSPAEGWAIQPPQDADLYGIHVLAIDNGSAMPPETGISADLDRVPPGDLMTSATSPDGSVLIGTYDGLHRFNPQDESFERLWMQGPDGDRLNTSTILRIFYDKQGSLWVGTHGEGLFRIEDLEHGLVRRFEMPDTPSRFYPFTAQERADFRNRVYDIVEDDDGTFWMPWFFGLNHFDPATGEVRIYEHAIDNEHTIGAGIVDKVIRDRHGALWVATMGGGLARLNRTRDRFHMLFDAVEQSGGQVGVAFRVAEGLDGSVWIVTPTGLHRIDPAGAEIQTFATAQNAGDQSALPGRWPASVYVTPSGQMWVGSDVALVHFNPNRGVVERHDINRLDSTGLAGEPSVLFEDSEGRFWVGTFGEGLHLFDRNAGVFKRYPYRERIARAGVSDTLDSDEVYAIVEDRKGTLWIGTGGGLNRFDPERGRFTSYYDETKGIANVRDIHEDGSGGLWLATEYGLIRFDPSNGESRRYDESAGLVHEFVGGILEDDAGNLWLNTLRGIVRFDPEREVFRTFDTDDGLPSLGFEASSLRLRSGRMIFGGRDGVVAVDPAELSPKDTAPVATIDHLTYRGAGGEVRVPTYGVENALLSFDQNDVTVHFAGIDFGQSAGVRYRYRLDGIDSDWVDGGTQRSARYPTLSPGDYTFELEAMSADGVWSTPATLALSVLPPWWQTWWAYVFYGLLFVAGVVAVDRMQRRRLMQREHERARERELEQARKIEQAYAELEDAYRELKQAQAQLVQQEKMASLGALTAGIAHEIKNPLNFVTNFAGLSKELLDELGDALKEGDIAVAREIAGDLALNTCKIEEHGHRADSIVRSMMQHARGTSGDREVVDICSFVEEYVNLAYHGKRASTPDFNVDIDRAISDDVGKIEIVPQDIGRVLLNLLGNAFDAVYEQSTRQAGAYEPRVHVAAVRTNGQLEIRISDNGPGIPTSIREKVFEPFFTTKPTGSGTGLGLSLSHDIVTQGHGGSLAVESENGAGATFIVLLPASTGKPADAGQSQ